MPLVVAKEKIIFFAHVPKTGGTSIANYMERRFGHLALADRRRYISKAGSPLIIPPNHFTAEDLKCFLPPIDHAFAVVRHPVSRIISEYRYQRGESRLSKFDFSTWLRVVIECTKREPRMYENNIRPQSDLVPDFAKPFKIEDGLERVTSYVDDLAQTATPKIEVPHLNQSKKLEVRLSKQDVLAIEGFYAVDYERFGYERHDTSKLANDNYAPLRTIAARAIAPVVIAEHKRGWTK